MFCVYVLIWEWVYECVCMSVSWWVIRQAKQCRCGTDCVRMWEGEKDKDEVSQTNLSFKLQPVPQIIPRPPQPGLPTDRHTLPPIQSDHSKKKEKKRGFPVKSKHTWCKQAHVYSMQLCRRLQHGAPKCIFSVTSVNSIVVRVTWKGGSAVPFLFIGSRPSQTLTLSHLQLTSIKSVSVQGLSL